jgi:hypothetical protein
MAVSLWDVPYLACMSENLQWENVPFGNAWSDSYDVQRKHVTRFWSLQVAVSPQFHDIQL